jgi:hypothetical protein
MTVTCLPLLPRSGRLLCLLVVTVKCPLFGSSRCTYLADVPGGVHADITFATIKDWAVHTEYYVFRMSTGRALGGRPIRPVLGMTLILLVFTKGALLHQPRRFGVSPRGGESHAVVTMGVGH